MGENTYDGNIKERGKKAKMNFHIKDISLAKNGQTRIGWSEQTMSVLRLVRRRFSRQRPLAGVSVGACLHVTTETANLMRTLEAGGAKVSLCASNPLSTQDDVAAALVKYDKIEVFAIKGEDKKTYYNHIKSVIATNPLITLDDGADLISTIHSKHRELLGQIIGGTEETTTGVIRLRSMAKDKALGYPIVAVNDALTKHLFDNRYGTGQSTIDGILRATNRLLAGSVFVVCGYGWCGRGVARRAKGMGARVIITEIDPLRAIEAHMDGYQVMPMIEAAKIGDFFVTITGNLNVIREKHFLLMKDGAILANSGHFDVEINKASLTKMAKSIRRIRAFVDGYKLENGHRLYLLGEGRLINLAAAEGHPSSVMDLSFANQALSVEYLLKEGDKLEKEVYPVPKKLDEDIARLKLKTLGLEIDSLTKEQQKYLSTWQMGT
jgi:adenosylhomocysteinase